MTLWVISICHWKPHETLFQTGQINTCTPLSIKLNSVVGNIEYCGSFRERKILVTGQATTSISYGHQITQLWKKNLISFCGQRTVNWFLHLDTSSSLTSFDDVLLLGKHESQGHKLTSLSLKQMLILAQQFRFEAYHRGKHSSPCHSNNHFFWCNSFGFGSSQGHKL